MTRGPVVTSGAAGASVESAVMRNVLGFGPQICPVASITIAANPVNPAALKPHAPKAAQTSSVGPTTPAGVSGAELQRRRDFTWGAMTLMLLVGLGFKSEIWKGSSTENARTRD